MTPEQTLAHASQAKRLLDDPLLKEALDSMEHDVIELWAACPARDVQGREWLWMELKNVRKFRDILRGAIENGKVAQESLKREQNMMERTLSRIRA